MTTLSEHPSKWAPSGDTFGARLALIRQQRRWNTKTAAQKTGIREQSWRNWEAGAHPRDLIGACETIEKAIGVDSDWLLTGRPGAGTQNLKSPRFPQPLPAAKCAA